MKIAVAGAGYVGMSNSILLAQNNEVVVYDTNASKVEKLNNNISPIFDSEIDDFVVKFTTNRWSYPKSIVFGGKNLFQDVTFPASIETIKESTSKISFLKFSGF